MPWFATGVATCWVGVSAIVHSLSCSGFEHTIHLQGHDGALDVGVALVDDSAPRNHGNTEHVVNPGRQTGLAQDKTDSVFQIRILSSLAVGTTQSLVDVDLDLL